MRCRSKNAGASADRVAPRPHQRFDACWSVQQLNNRLSTRLARKTRRKASWYLTTLRLESNNAAGHGARQSRTKASTANNGVSVTTASSSSAPSWRWIASRCARRSRLASAGSSRRPSMTAPSPRADAASATANKCASRVGDAFCAGFLNSASARSRKFARKSPWPARKKRFSTRSFSRPRSRSNRTALSSAALAAYARSIARARRPAASSTTSAGVRAAQVASSSLSSPEHAASRRTTRYFPAVSTLARWLFTAPPAAFPTSDVKRSSQ